MKSEPKINLLSSLDWTDYALLDSGNGKKLERYGKYRLVRPEPEAIWKPALPVREWEKANAIFEPGAETHGGHWKTSSSLPERWEMTYKGLRFWVQPSASRHLGVFPEQANHWDWLRERINAAGRPVKVLNLFGYTGMASLAAAQAGAQVTHLDASQRVIQWAKENQQLSGLDDRSIRWIKDDALKFVRREERRSSLYDIILLDPPKFGRGPQGEVWEFYDLIATLLDCCRRIMSSQPSGVILTAYAVKASSLTLYHAVSEMMGAWGGTTTAGEIIIREESAGRLLSTAVYARWNSE